MCMLGFIRWQCSNFSDIRCLSMLYYYLVRSNLKYGSLIWSSSQIGFISRLNNVQYYFLRYVYYKFMMNCSIKKVALKLGMRSLASRRKLNDVLFIYKILNGYIICPEILELIVWLVSTFHTRSKKIFFETFHS
jgi:hypothetical protein